MCRWRGTVRGKAGTDLVIGKAAQGEVSLGLLLGRFSEEASFVGGHKTSSSAIQATEASQV